MAAELVIPVSGSGSIQSGFYIVLFSSREGKGCNCNLKEILRSRACKGRDLTMRNYSTARGSIFFCQSLGSLNLLGVECRRLQTFGTSILLFGAPG